MHLEVFWASRYLQNKWSQKGCNGHSASVLKCWSVGWFAMEKVCFPTKNKLYLGLKEKYLTSSIQNNSVNKGIFHFLEARIWVPMPVYRYENPSGYVTVYNK